MKKLILFLLIVFGFSMQNNHFQTDDKGMQLALQGKYKEALVNFIDRCSNNEGFACGMVGYFYERGFGVEKNHNLAIKFYKKGCSLGDADSCTLLGYEKYKEKNLKEAKELLKKGCDLGNKDACKYCN